LQLKAPKTENRNLDLHLENAFSAKQKQKTPHNTITPQKMNENMYEVNSVFGI